MKEVELIEKLQKLLIDESIDYQRILELTSELSKFDEENLRFQTDAGAITHLGKDSIKDHTTAILELVKNSYDADAKRVEIIIQINNHLKDSWIKIIDDGIGMSENDVLSNWLRIGYSEKKINKKSTLNRRKTGEKGIGRLSADRLGQMLTIKTKKNRSKSFGFKVNWGDFDKRGVNLSLIPFSRVPLSDIDFLLGDTKTGTNILISSLRDTWTTSDLKRLEEELSILVSPFREKKDFKVSIQNNFDPSSNGVVVAPEHIKPEVQIDVFYDGESNDIKYSIEDKYGTGTKKEKSISWNSLTQTSGLLRDIKGFDVSNEKPTCGPVIYSLMFYLRSASSLKGTGFSLSQLKEYLQYNGGVKIYRDDISVKPYGFSGKDGEDWLNLGERQGQNPAGLRRPDWMVKNNQVLGAVYISRDENENLRDSAAREGLVHNKAYYDLRALVLCGMRLLEIHRHKIQLKIDANNPKPSKPNAKQLLELYQTKLVSVQKELEAIKEEKDSEIFKERIERSSAMLSTAIEFTQSAEKQVEALLNKNRTLSGLATLGISSAVFGHETAISISQFRKNIYEAKISLNEVPPDIEEAKRELNLGESYAKYVGEWGAFALSRIRRDKRTQKKIQVEVIFDKLINDIEPSFKSRKIELLKNLQPVEARTFPMDLETILINLLTNSYSACLNTGRDRKILVSLKELEKSGNAGFEIAVSDSGPGVQDELKNIIWEPLFTTKSDDKGNNNGTGLGLSIVNSIVDDLGGTKEVTEDKDLLGAKFSIWFPNKKKKK
ncbi:MAG: sensor histidine kinase [Bacteroidota bacterium]